MKITRNERGNSITKLHYDNGKDYLNHQFQDYLAKAGICHELIAPYSPEQNSVAERDNHTIMECARSFLHQSEVSIVFWAEAKNRAVYILNQVASRTLHDQTPLFKWNGKILDVSHFQIFGNLCYAHVPTKLCKKLD